MEEAEIPELGTLGLVEVATDLTQGSKWFVAILVGVVARFGQQSICIDQS